MGSPNFLAIPVDYTVKSGDSLSKISLALYGDYKYWPDLQKLNAMDDPNTLEIGEVIQVYRPLTVTNTAPGSGGTPYTLNQTAAPVPTTKPATAGVTVPAPATPAAGSKFGTVISNMIKDPKILIGIALAIVAAVAATMPKKVAAAVSPNPCHYRKRKHHRRRRK